MSEQPTNKNFPISPKTWYFFQCDVYYIILNFNIIILYNIENLTFHADKYLTVKMIYESLFFDIMVKLL
jgi:hypothetical protein